MAPLLSFHLLVAFLVVVAGGTYDDSVVCESSTPCGDHVDVKYPFYLANATGAASRCGGYPGLGVICEDDGARRRATLRLGDHNYTVLEINHANHTVTVADSDVLDAGGGGSDCPRVKHNVTLPPVLTFPVTNNDSISFFLDCDFTGAIAQPPDITEINCTGFERAPGAAPSFLAPRPDTPAGEWFRACREVFVAPVIRDWLLSKEYYPTLRDGGYGGVLRRGFQMSWDPTAGQCYVCEQSGGRCSYGGAQNDFQGCLCSDGHVRNLVCGK